MLWEGNEIITISEHSMLRKKAFFLTQTEKRYYIVNKALIISLYERIENSEKNNFHLLKIEARIFDGMNVFLWSNYLFVIFFQYLKM